MNQPPKPYRGAARVPDWRRPVGVSPGTWSYVNERSIADHYDAFVADTPLCTLDQQILQSEFPSLDKVHLSCRDSTLKHVEPPSIIDLGCGSGRTAIRLAERGYQVIGVDLSSRMLELLQQKAHSEGLQNKVHCIRANLVELDGIASHSIDHAVCLFSTLGMVQGRANRRRMLAQVSRIVVSGGRFVLHVHNRWSALREPQGLRKLAKSFLQSKIDRSHEFGDSVYQYRGLEKMFMHRFSRHELLSDLRDSGWSVRKFHSVSIDGSEILSSQKGWNAASRNIGGFLVIAENRTMP